MRTRLRLSAETVYQIDRYARAHDVPREQAVEMILLVGLAKVRGYEYVVAQDGSGTHTTVAAMMHDFVATDGKDASALVT